MLTTEVDYEDGGGILFEDIGFKGPVAERLSHKADLVVVRRWGLGRARGLHMNAHALATWTLMLTVCVSAGPSHSQSKPGPEMPPPVFAKLPDGRRIALYCEGLGTPTVILDSGLGMSASVWRRVQPELAKKTRTCSYDRAGYGLSDPGPLPRDARHIAADLDAALRAAHLAGPYILVGHSMGGFDMRMYANLHRASVAGMVLVDPSIDGNDKPLIAASTAWARQTAADDQAAMTCIGAAAAGRMRPGDPAYGACGSPPPGSARTRPEMARAVLSERDSLDASSDEVAATQIRYEAMPLIVLTAGAQFGPESGASPADRDVLLNVWRNGHKQIAHSSGIGVERVVEGAPHLIQIAKPEAVIDAVAEVISECR